MKAEVHLAVKESQTTSGKHILEIRCLDENYTKVKVFKNEVMNQTRLAIQLKHRFT